MKPATRFIVAIGSIYWMFWIVARLVILGFDSIESVCFCFAAAWFASSVFPLEEEKEEKKE